MRLQPYEMSLSIGDVVKTLTDSHGKIKLGNIFITLLSEMKDSIVYDKLGRIPIIHHNEVILNSDIEIHTD